LKKKLKNRLPNTKNRFLQSYSPTATYNFLQLPTLYIIDF